MNPQRIWLKAQLGTPSLVQKNVIFPLRARKTSLRSILKPFVNVYSFREENQAGSLITTYIGLDKVINPVKQSFFTENLEVTKVDKIPLWQIPKIITTADSDMIMVVAGEQITKALPKKGAITSPSQVNMILNIEGKWEDVKRRLHKNLRKKIFRTVEKYGYTHRISHKLEDFDFFYHHMYAPTMQARHGAFKSIWDKEDAFIFFKHGYLTILEKDGQNVAGLLSYPEGDNLIALASGVFKADETLLNEDALGAARILTVQWAYEQHFKAVDFMGNAPWLDIGIFRYKRRWGSTVTIPTDEDGRIWLKVRRNTPAVLHRLKEHPFIIIDKKNTLYGLVLTDELSLVTDKQRSEWRKKYTTPGLKNLLLYSVTDLIKDPVSLQSATLI